VNNILVWLRDFTAHDFPLFHIGKTDITLGQLLSILIGITLLFIISSWTRQLVAQRLLARNHIDLNTRYTIASLVRYSMLVIGFIVIMQNAGINLSAFSVLAGAVGVGIGFGLQNIVSNFISGLIVMFERPVKIGDRIDLVGVEGDVIDIGARATRIKTAEGSVVIMPNQQFITSPVKNWADADERSPLVLTVNVDKASDMRMTSEVLKTTICKHTGVVSKPATEVWLTGITGSGNFKVLAWVSGGPDERNRIMHELYLAIFDALAEKQIKLA
jgi:small-conductance mechanosensitive channel